MERLLLLHAPYLRKVLQIRIHPELAPRVDLSDVEQETRMTIMKRIEEFATQRSCSFRVWLRRRAIEQLADEYRRHIAAEKRSVRREVQRSDQSSMVIARALVHASLSERLHRQELAEQIRQLIETLPANDQEILTLRYAEGLSNREAAEALDVPIDTVRKRYGRAIRRLVEKVTAAGLKDSISFE